MNENLSGVLGTTKPEGTLQIKEKREKNKETSVILNDIGLPNSWLPKGCRDEGPIPGISSQKVL